MTGLALTWWGHATTTVEIGGVRIAIDPLLTDRLFHLRRYSAAPTERAQQADLVLISHLHADHLHLPSLLRFAPDVPVVLPRGGERHLGPRRAAAVPVIPGDVLDLGGVRIEVLPASHDGRRHPLSRQDAPALGFRVETGGASFWFPGDTGLRADMAQVRPVDLALAPIGGWGPSLGAEHLDPIAAAQAVGAVGATWTVPVHWGTFWPQGLARLDPARHRYLFQTPGERFAEAMRAQRCDPLFPAHGERVVLR